MVKKKNNAAAVQQPHKASKAAKVQQQVENDSSSSSEDAEEQPIVRQIGRQQRLPRTAAEVARHALLSKRKNDYIYQAVKLLQRKKEKAIIGNLDRLIASHNEFKQYLNDYKKQSRKAIAKRIYTLTGRQEKKQKDKEAAEVVARENQIDKEPRRQVRKQLKQQVKHAKQELIEPPVQENFEDEEEDGEEEDEEEEEKQPLSDHENDMVDENESSHSKEANETVSEGDEEQEVEGGEVLPPILPQPLPQPLVMEPAEQRHSKKLAEKSARIAALERELEEQTEQHRGIVHDMEDQLQVTSTQLRELIQKEQQATLRLEQERQQHADTKRQLDEAKSQIQESFEARAEILEQIIARSEQIRHQIDVTTQEINGNLSKLRNNQVARSIQQPEREQEEEKEDIDNTMTAPPEMAREDFGLSDHLFKRMVQERQELHRDVCSICMEAFRENQKIIALYCHPLHRFHTKCLDFHFYKTVLCPTCKSDQYTHMTGNMSRLGFKNRQLEQLRQQANPFDDGIHGLPRPNQMMASSVAAPQQQQPPASAPQQQVQAPMLPASIHSHVPALEQAGIHEIMGRLRLPNQVPPSPPHRPEPISPVRQGNVSPSAMLLRAVSNFGNLVNAAAAVRVPSASAESLASSAFRVPNHSSLRQQQQQQQQPPQNDVQQHVEDMPMEYERSSLEDELNEEERKQHGLLSRMDDNAPAMDHEMDNSEDAWGNVQMAENAEVTILAHRREVSPDSSFRLNPDVWLNDSIIDNFSVWLNNLQRHRGNTEVWSFSYSATRTIVVREGNMRRPFYKAVAANSNTLLFPVSLNGVHWALIIVYTDMHKIYIVDSMLQECRDGSHKKEPQYGADYPTIVERIKKNMRVFYKARYIQNMGENIDREEAEELAQSDVAMLEDAVVVQNAAQQHNTHDCGVFTCLNMLIMARTNDISRLAYPSSNTNMVEIRHALKRDLLTWNSKDRMWRKFLEVSGQSDIIEPPADEMNPVDVLIDDAHMQEPVPHPAAAQQPARRVNRRDEEEVKGNPVAESNSFHLADVSFADQPGRNAHILHEPTHVPFSALSRAANQLPNSKQSPAKVQASHVTPSAFMDAESLFPRLERNPEQGSKIKSKNKQRKEMRYSDQRDSPDIEPHPVIGAPQGSKKKGNGSKSQKKRRND